jgi:hypothetical protein
MIRWIVADHGDYLWCCFWAGRWQVRVWLSVANDAEQTFLSKKQNPELNAEKVGVVSFVTWKRKKN